MSVKVFAANWYGVDIVTMAFGDGLVQPRLLTAASLDHNTVRITYDRTMYAIRDAIGDPVPNILNPKAYRIFEASSGVSLSVIAVEKISDTAFDLTTSLQRNVTYNVEVEGVFDQFGLVIDPLYNTVNFTGSEPTYPAAALDFYAFFGMYSGMQETGQSNVAPDLTPPVWDNLTPNAGDINVPVATTVGLDVVDPKSGVNGGSVIIKVNGVNAWHTETQQIGFTVVRATIAGGHSYLITPDVVFDSYDDVVINVYAVDEATIPNTLDSSYSFRTLDIEAPFVANHNPAPDDTGVTPLAVITLDVLDVGNPLVVGSVIITIDGVIAWQGDSLQNSFTGTKQALTYGYRYALTPPLPLPMLTLIVVRVQAVDSAPSPNVLDATYSFTTAIDIPPEVRNMDPERGEGNVDTSASIEFDAWDNVGIDESKTLVVVNNVLAYQGSTPRNGFSAVVSVIADGYHYEIAPPSSWPFGSSVTVQVYLQDDLSVTSNTAWIFYIYEDPDCFTGPVNAFEASLLVPYDLAGTTLYHTEILRSQLLMSVSVRVDPIKAIRQIYLRAFRSELGSMLRNLLVAPSKREAAVKLCYKKTIIQIDTALRRKPGLLKATLTELKALGLPVPHSQMLWRYLSTDEPNDLVPLACVIVVLAKALEENALS